MNAYRYLFLALLTTPSLLAQEAGLLLWPAPLPDAPAFSASYQTTPQGLPAELLQGDVWMPEEGHRMSHEAYDADGLLRYRELLQLNDAGRLVGRQVFYPGGKQAAYRYRYDSAGQLQELTGPAGRFRVEQPEQLPGSPYQLQAYRGTDTLALVPEDETISKYYLVVDDQQRLRQWLEEADGKIIQHHLYEYPRQQARRTHRLMTGRSKQAITENATQGTEAEIAAKRWFRAWGSGPWFYLGNNGQFFQYEPGTESPRYGHWQQRPGELQLNYEDRREATEFTVTPAGGAIGLMQADSSRQYWLPATPPQSARLRQWQEELESRVWKSITERGRSGLKHERDGRTLEAAYDAVTPLSAQLARVELEGLQGLIRYDGRAVTPIYYEGLQPVGPGVLAAKRGGKCALLRVDGDSLTAFAYDQILLFADTLLLVQRDGQYGLMKPDGRLLVEPAYDALQPFRFGRAIVEQNGELGAIDESGSWALPPQPYLSLQPVAAGYYLARNLSGRWGLISEAGETMLPFDYLYLSPLSTQVLLAQKGGQFGLFTMRGQPLSPVRYRVLKGCDERASYGLCENLLRNQAIARYLSDVSFGYLDGYGRAFPPVLPTAEALEADYQTVDAGRGLLLTFPKGQWQFEPSVGRLYKQGDYGRVRVQYEWLDTGGTTAERWLSNTLSAAQAEQLKRGTIDGREALYFTEKQRIRYYDFFKKFWYVPTEEGLLKLEFSCKDDSYLDNAQDLYEIERLIQLTR